MMSLLLIPVSTATGQASLIIHALARRLHQHDDGAAWKLRMSNCALSALPGQCAQVQRRMTFPRIVIPLYFIAGA
jgi:hypothetical protein